MTCTNEYADPSWEVMWKNGIQPGTRFDTISPSPALIKYIQQEIIPNGRSLVPGCGRGYDLMVLADKNRTVIGLDYSETAIAAAKQYLNGQDILYRDNMKLVCGSFFDLPTASQDDLFDFIYDYTFLCALSPKVRKDWARKMSELIVPGGQLMTIIFPIKLRKEDQNLDVGPPYHVTLELYSELLLPVGFKCVELAMLPSELCHVTRDGSAPSFYASGLGRWIKI